MSAENMFPALPDAQVVWAPLYLEPIVNSGERITIAIAAVGQNGEVRVERTLREDQVLCAFGSAGTALLNTAQICIDSVTDHLSNNHELTGWQAPLVGAAMGEIRTTEAYDLSTIMRLGMQLTSAFASLSAREIEALDSEVSSLGQEDRLPMLIRKAVVAVAPRLDVNFHVRFKTTPNGRPVTFDYLGSRYVANFGRLIPSSNRLSSDMGRCRTKLWSLEALRDSATTLSIDAYELIVLRPADDDALYSEAQIAALQENLITLTDEARKQDLEVLPVYDVGAASTRIVEAESAA